MASERCSSVAGWPFGAGCGGVEPTTPEFFVSVADKGLIPDFIGPNEEVASDEWLAARVEVAGRDSLLRRLVRLAGTPVFFVSVADKGVRSGVSALTLRGSIGAEERVDSNAKGIGGTEKEKPARSEKRTADCSERAAEKRGKDMASDGLR